MTALPEVHLIGSEPGKLAAVVLAMRSAGLLTPIQLPAPAGGDPVPDVTLTSAGPLAQLAELWAERPPAAVIVQGDTAAALAGALAAFWCRIPVVHLEAGLRSTDPLSPAEADRRLIAQVAALHLAPTPLAAMNLLDEGIATGDVLLIGGPQRFAGGEADRDDDALADDALAAGQTAQATAALLGLAERPEPAPGPPAPTAPRG